MMASKTKLLDQVRLVIRLKHMSIRTEEAYVQWVKRFVLFHHKRHPQDMGAVEIRAFLVHLALHEHVAASTQNVALNALVLRIGNIHATVGCAPPDEMRPTRARFPV